MGAVRSNITVQIGLFMFPVNIESSLQSDNDTALKTLCIDDHDPVAVRQTLACPSCGNRERTTFKKGKAQGGGFIVVDEATLESVNGVTEEVKNRLELTAVPTDQVDERTIPGGKFYFLSPGKTAGPLYALAADYVAKHPDTALVGVFAVKGKPAMYRLRIYREALAIQELAFPEAVATVPSAEHIRPEHAAYADQLVEFVEVLRMDFDPANFIDQRAAKLKDYFATQDAIAAGTVPVQVGTPTKADPTSSLMEALAKATAAAKPATEPAKTPAKRTTRARSTTATPARKTAARKAPTRTTRKAS